MSDPGQHVIAQLQESYGVGFDGEPWILMAPIEAPKQETVFVAALNPLTVKATKGQAELQLALLETDYGFVFRFSVILYDDPKAPLELRLPLNPASNAAGPHLEQLAGQGILRIFFYDALSGDFITVRNLPIAPEIRAALKQILELAATRPSSPELWAEAVKAAGPAL
jgi:hypothetical protein